MLTTLTISNYALIDELSVAFEPGLNSITGETGAGKSILLGALSLILGARADLSVLRDLQRKCVVEGTFKIEQLGLEAFFAENDLDYDVLAVLRREISPAGKSRAFINDTPVTLLQMRELALRLTDIHSQHQNLELSSQNFQLQVVDFVANTRHELTEYRACFSFWRSALQQLETLRERAVKARGDADYIEFQYQQLSDAHLVSGESQELEMERERLAHAREITETFSSVSESLDGDAFPVLQQLKEAIGKIDRIVPYIREAADFRDRMESAYLELREIERELNYQSSNITYNPQRLQEINDRLDLIYSLEQKHQVEGVEALIELCQKYEKQLEEVVGFDDEIHRLEKECAAALEALENAATNLSNLRRSVFSTMESRVTAILRQLGMQHALFRVYHEELSDYAISGRDAIQFQFSANKNGVPADIAKIASGGELSRVMLAIKTLVSGSRMLPTIIFDEIDAGISGEVALKMGAILQELSGNMQVINITHLPQIAARGNHHYKVYKYENETATITALRKLSDAERIDEIASMVGGDQPTESNRNTAIELLKGN